MISRSGFRTVLTFLGVCTLASGCDVAEKDDQTAAEESTGPDAGSEGAGQTSAGDTTGGGGGGELVALNESFDAWDGGGERFFLARGDATAFPDHNTAVTIADRAAVAIHAAAQDNSGYGFGVEIQLQLDQPTDMSGEDFNLSFDIYIPAATFDLGANVQWGFFETENFTPIYSAWTSPPDIVADQWVTISTPINTTTITYSTFAENPADWLVDVVRIQTIVNGETAVADAEVLYYIDNVVVSNTPPAAE